MFDNVLTRNSKAHGGSEVLVTDITYLSTNKGFLYLSIVQGLYTNEIVAWKMNEHNDVDLNIDTLTELTSKRNMYRFLLLLP